MDNGYKILSIEAKDLYGAMNPIAPVEKSYIIRNADGELSFRHFVNTISYSLDTIKLEEIYTKITKRKYFGFIHKGNKYTQNIINVTFNYSYKNYNKVGSNCYVKAGYNIFDCEFNDSICIKDNEVIAIITGQPVINSVSNDILGTYFKVENGCYEQSKDFKTIKNRFELREYLYKNGFVCDGIKYVRYKRSCGSSRLGKVLFINEILAKRMAKWDTCGLKIRENDKIDLAAYEAYISLPMSSIIDTVEIKPENFLVIDDYESVFNDDVVAVEERNGKLVANEKNMQIKNSIWDGESLMDKSLFGKYEDKGMLLLRNQFFKTCAFNTNIQQYFLDNNITSIEQLNGFTLATDISQIKIITTPSSIKYLKFGKLEDWFKNIDHTFGIVKYEKETHFFDGRLVRTHYQLLNTLQLSYKELEKVVEPTLDYIHKVRTDADVLRFHINYGFNNQIEDSPLNNRNEIIFKLLGLNNLFEKTKLYHQFKQDLLKSIRKNLQQGRVNIVGNYSTLLGNGMEMLQSSIGKFNGNSVINPGEIHSKNFEFNKTILGSRSPHVTMGNILLAKNVANEDIDKYFNLTNEIVYVNAIKDNIQQKLNGADYDSDTMLLTDDEGLIKAAQKNYDKFKVPTNFVESIKTQRYYNDEHKSDLDVKTSVNKIGEIINLSQQLNSILWNRVSQGEQIESLQELYNDICKLSVLSNIEIDKAKKEFIIDSEKEIETLKEKYQIVKDGKFVKPKFFEMITKKNGYELPENVFYDYFNTSMDYLQKIIKSNSLRKKKKQKETFIPFMSIVKKPEIQTTNYTFYNNKKDNIINLVNEYRNEIVKLHINYETATKEDRKIIKRMCDQIREDYIEKINSEFNNEYVMYITLKELDNDENKSITKFLFDLLFGQPNKMFFNLIRNSQENMYKLKETEHGNINLYCFNYEKTYVSV